MERYTSCKVELDLFDTTASSEAMLMALNVQPFANIENIRQRNSIKKIATLESDYFLLDGTFNYYDDLASATSIGLPENEGYVSNDYTTLILAIFSNNHSNTGITFHFWEMVPKEIYINFYKNNIVFTSQHFYPKKNDCEITVGNDLTEYTYYADIPAEDYNQMAIVFDGGDRFVRINYIDYGFKLIFGEDDRRKLKSCTITEEADALSTEMSINQSTVEIIDMENLFKITNPSSYYKYLQKRQTFKITEIIDGQEVFIASHYLKEWSQEKEHSATFTLQDILGIMSDTTFYGGLYTNIKAGDLFKAIFDDFGYEDYDIEEDVKNTVLTGYVKVMSHKDALQQVAFACGACVTTSRVTGIKVFKPLYENVGFIDLDRKLLSNSETIQDDLVTAINISAHSYVRNPTSKEVYKGDFEPGTYRVTFSNPCDSLSITGGTIAKSDYNYADVVVSETGEVIITGNEYEDHTVVYKYTEVDDLPSSASENIVEVNNATLISKSNALDVAKLLYYIKQYRLKHKCKVIIKDEEVANMYALKVIDEYAPLLITKMETDLTGGFISSIEGIGYALKIQDYYRAGTEIYAGDEII